MKLISPANDVSAVRGRRAFTLIEMLVVIAIIVILAGLVVGLAPLANKKMRQAKVEACRDALITYIQSYKLTKGTYPPDNTNDPSGIQTSLFYELTGTISTNGNTAFVSITQEPPLSSGTIANDFGGATGFLNASADPTEVKNFCGRSLKSDQYALVNATVPPGSGKFTVLGVVVPGPANLQLQTTTLPYINPWHYISSNPTNNPDSYDLWMDVVWGGKTNRISNWSKDPQPL